MIVKSKAAVVGPFGKTIVSRHWPSRDWHKAQRSVTTSVRVVVEEKEPNRLASTSCPCFSRDQLTIRPSPLALTRSIVITVALSPNVKHETRLTGSVRSMRDRSWNRGELFELEAGQPLLSMRLLGRLSARSGVRRTHRCCFSSFSQRTAAAGFVGSRNL